ncbi:hypothetical protein C1645_743520 [Glomus cerebriforme]|uniref:Uncharacterized protein n=1 Tax=Glomus cerebriforme TaxID=658196 RepID=A0A397SA00_9GLOM|nr:hypothetical protein C1645_743520 [Glomus cerebriforme]
MTDIGEKMTSTVEKMMFENRIMKLSADEHLSNVYPIPELLMSEIMKITNLEENNNAKGKGELSTDANLSLWTNTNYGYYEDADILSVNFTRKADVLRDYCDHIDDLLICYVLNNKIISVQIFHASALLYCHLFDYNKMIDNKPPLCLYSVYCEDRDELSVYFTDYPSTKRLQSIEVEKDIILQMSDDGKLVALLFCNANVRIAKEFSKEDRERLREKYKLRTLVLNSSK